MPINLAKCESDDVLHLEFLVVVIITPLSSGCHSFRLTLYEDALALPGACEGARLDQHGHILQDFLEVCLRLLGAFFEGLHGPIHMDVEKLMQHVDKLVLGNTGCLVDLAALGSGRLDELLEHVVEVDVQVVVVEGLGYIGPLFAALNGFFDPCLVEFDEFLRGEGIRSVLAVCAADECGLLWVSVSMRLSVRALG